MADNISYIHNNKLGKYLRRYVDARGNVYIGQRDGRLKKEEAAVVSTTATTNLDTTLSWGNITGTITNQGDLVTYINNVVGAMTLDGLADVVITAPAGGDVLVYDAVNNIWINSAGGGGGGVATFSGGTTGLTPVAPTAGPVTLGGTLVAANGGTGHNTYILGETLYASGPTTLSKLAGNTTIAKQFLSQTGTGVVSAAPAWSAITASDIGGGQALTKVDDTNVTLTLGGTPTLALLASVSLTLGWTGTLAVSRGGSGASSLTGVLIGNGAAAFSDVVGTAGQLLRRNLANTAYEFFTPSYLTAAITSLNGLTVAVQNFVNDTNVTITSAGSNHTLGWSGVLAIARGGTGLNALGSSLQYLRVNSAGTALEYATLPVIPPATTVTGRTGDINVVTSGSNYEVQNAVMPFLLMGC